MSQTSANLYGLGVGTSSTTAFIPVVAVVDPTTSDTKNAEGPYNIGKRWVNKASNVTWTLASFTTLNGALTANWVSEGGGGGGNLNTLTGDTGTANPVLGNIKIAGAAPIVTSATGSTVTVGLSGVSGINSWTPVLSFGGTGGTTGITYNMQYGSYYQIGPIIFFSCWISLTSKGSSTGTAAIDGLPISVGINPDQNTGVLSFFDNVTMSVNYVTPFWQFNGNVLDLLQEGSGQPFDDMNDTNFANNSAIIFSGMLFQN